MAAPPTAYPSPSVSSRNLRQLLVSDPVLCENLANAMERSLKYARGTGVPQPPGAVTEEQWIRAPLKPLFPPQMRLVYEVCHSAVPEPGTTLTPLQRVQSFLDFNDKLVAWIPSLFNDTNELVMTNIYNFILVQHFVYAPKVVDFTDFFRPTKTDKDGKPMKDDEGSEIKEDAYIAKERDPVSDAILNNHAFREWMRESAREWGNFCDTQESVTDDAVRSLELSQQARDKEFRMNMEQYIEPPSGFKSWNQVFARETAPGWRPQDYPNEPDMAVVSPADSIFQAWFRINDKGDVEKQQPDGTFAKEECIVKGKAYGTVYDLLGAKGPKDRAVADEFKGGLFFHSFLGPADYHRFRAPVRGIVQASKVLTGHVFLEVQLRPANVTPQGEDGCYRYFSAPDNTRAGESDDELDDESDSTERTVTLTKRTPAQRAAARLKKAVSTFNASKEKEPLGEDPCHCQESTWQFQQQRGLLLLRTACGPVAVLPIGMAQVSGVHMTAQKGSVLAKGEEFGYFAFGGSDIITVYPPAAQFRPALRYVPFARQAVEHKADLEAALKQEVAAKKLTDKDVEELKSADFKPTKCVVNTFIGKVTAQPFNPYSEFDPYDVKVTQSGNSQPIVLTPQTEERNKWLCPRFPKPLDVDWATPGFAAGLSRIMAERAKGNPVLARGGCQ